MKRYYTTNIVMALIYFISFPVISTNVLAEIGRPLVLLVDDDYPDRDLPYCTRGKEPDGTCRPKETAPVEQQWPFPWKTSWGGIFCRNYFSLKEAEAALRARDQHWFKQTGCVETQTGLTAIIIDAPKGQGTNVWHGRLSGENFHFYDHAVENYARSGPYPTRRAAKEAFLALQRRFKKSYPTSETAFEYTYATDRQGQIHLLVGPKSHWLLVLFCATDWRNGKPVQSCEVPQPLL
jgi:hypothetical protein